MMQDRECRVFIESDEEIDGGFSCLLQEKETGSQMKVDCIVYLTITALTYVFGYWLVAYIVYEISLEENL